MNSNKMHQMIRIFWNNDDTEDLSKTFWRLNCRILEMSSLNSGGGNLMKIKYLPKPLFIEDWTSLDRIEWPSKKII